jgi:WD40 repeat protein
MRLLTGHKYRIGKLTFSPDSRWLLLTSVRGIGEVYESDAVRLWDVAAGTSRVLRRAFHPVFTPDGRSVLYVEKDGDFPPEFSQLSLQLFDLASGKAAPLTVPGRGPGDFGEPLFTPDGSRLLSLSPWLSGPVLDGLVLNWTAFPGWEAAGQWSMNERLDRVGMALNLFAVAFSPCGKTLATVSEAGLVLFDVATGELSYRRDVGPNETGALARSVRFLAYHPDGRQLAFAFSNKMTVFDTRTWKPVAELSQKRKHILSGAFTPDGRCFLTASNEETVKCWDTASWTLKREYAWEVGGLRTIAVAPDGMTAAAGGDKAAIVLFDLDD